MTDKMREEFEAAYAAGVRQQKGESAFHPASLTRSTDGYYVISMVQSAWWGWQQSRESLVVDLPTVGPSPEPPEDAIDDSFLDAHHAKIRMRNDCFMAIKAASITIAGESN